jgi:glycosyltransferase involved in cell wall biosynthesis
MIPRVRYYGPFAQRTGYGQACHDYLLALHLAGVRLDIRPLHEADTDHLDPRYGALIEFAEAEPEWSPTHVVVHTIPKYAHEFVSGDLDPGPGVKKIVITTWETDAIHPADAACLDRHFDLVIVPSHFNAQVFVKAGLPAAKVYVVPHTFDPRFWWSPGQEAAPKKSPYSFYSVLSWVDRKNPIGLLKAYLTEFRAHDDVVLRILTPTVNEDDVRSLVGHLGIPNPPKIEFYGVWGDGRQGRLEETALRDFHRRSHCFVTLTRGEGWGLGAFEAALVGNPVIATGFSGLRDFLDEYVTTYVPYFLTPAITPEIKIGELDVGGIKLAQLAPGAPTGISGEQSWAEPNLHTAKALLRRAYTERWQRTTAHRASFVARFGYVSVGAQLRVLLESS